MTDRPIPIVDAVDYWRDLTLEELISQVDAQPVSGPAVLKIHGVTPAEWDALYDTLAMEREERPRG